MTRDDIIRMARNAGLIECDCCLPFWPEEDQVNWEIFFERFAALVEAHLDKKYPIQLTHEQYNAVINAALADEREACAKVAEAYEPKCDSCPSGVANAIRARGKG
jgi:hypothetical protein